MIRAPRRAARPLDAWVWLAVLAVGACDLGRDDPSAEGPAPRLLQVRATTGEGSDGGPVLQRIDVDDPPLVLTTAHFELSFDRFLSPVDVSRQALCLHSDPRPVTGFDECVSGVLLRPSYDPVRRAARYYLESPSARLAPDTLYTLQVYAPRGSGDFGFRAFDGVPFETPVELRFRTAADPRPGAMADGPPAPGGYCNEPGCAGRCGGDPACLERCGPGARAVLRAACASASCHGATEAGPAMGLLLGTDEGLRETAIDRVAHQTQLSGRASSPQARPARFGAQMKIIAPGDAGASYLLYKILLRPELIGQGGPLADGELERIQSFTVGMPMPVPGFELDASAAESLADWVMSGAPIEACP